MMRPFAAFCGGAARLTLVALLAGTAAAPLAAQGTLLPRVNWSTGIVGGGWHFTTPVAQPAGRLGDVAQVAVPVNLGLRVGGWRLDASGAFSVGGVRVAARQGTGRVLQVAGPADVRVRATGPLFFESLHLTAGVNVTTGLQRLDDDQYLALQAVGAPAMGMPAPVFGTGPGATLGMVKAFSDDNWAFAVGAAYEARSQFTPLAVVADGDTFATLLTPGNAVHATAGFDRVAGSVRWNAIVIADVYTDDQVIGTLNGFGYSLSGYRLGPQLTANSSLEFAGDDWRERRLSAGVRRRGAFADSAGRTVQGSAGTFLEANLTAVRGGPVGRGLVLGLDGRLHSGMPFTTALVGAAMTSVGATLGFDHLGGSSWTRAYLRAQYGTFDTGVNSTSGFGATLGLTFGSRATLR
jgi:hypothetical protein